MAFSGNVDQGPPAVLGINSTPSALLEMLNCDDIAPGSNPSYQMCKTIYTYHPLGGKMAESPIKLAQSQKREIQIPGAPEKELKEAFDKVWRKIGNCGADSIIRNTFSLSRVYGIASLMMGVQGQDNKEPVDFKNLYKSTVYFNVLDPLNTAGSLVLNLDPNNPDYLKPPKFIQVAGIPCHASRTVVLLNEQPIYLEWTNSAFGFVGRSVYQRAFYPLKTYVQSMITDNMVTEKAGLLVTKMKAPGSIIDQVSRAFNALKRTFIKGAKTYNVLSVGIEESVESLDMKNLKDAAEFARNNVLKNIATAADMPASLINQETLAEGFGEGSEDAKNIARFIDGIRIEAQPIYDFMDNVVMHLAWNPDFYASIQRKYPKSYADIPYETAFIEWKNAFIATWPNLLQEPDSKKIEVEDKTFKAAIAAYQVMVQNLDPENRANLTEWFANVLNNKPLLFDSHLEIDLEILKEFTPPALNHEFENPPESGRD